MNNQFSYLLLWGEHPRFQYEEIFANKQLAILRFNEIREWKKDLGSEHWAKVYECIGDLND